MFLKRSDMTADACVTILRMVNIIEETMDGPAGAIYSIFFAALASALRSLIPVTHIGECQIWSMAAKTALGLLQRATSARIGDRTLVDSPGPFIVSLGQGEMV
jgi:dihydroxyacetone kinase